MNAMMSDAQRENSSDSKWKLMLISILAYGTFLVIMFVNVISEEDTEKIPLTNLPQPIHITILTIVWPLVGGFLAVYVFPRLLVPLYMKVKATSHKNYTNCVIQLERPVNLKFVLKRAFMVFLLVMGLESALMPMLDLTRFYMPNQLIEQDIVEELLPYNPQAFIVTAGILFPFAMILWVLVWTIQDSGLMHYQLSENLTKYQEIEPVYFKISGYVKGFAGITSIFFYFNALYHISMQGLSEWLNFVWVFFVSVIVMVWSMLFIVLYSNRNFGWVTKDVKLMARLQVEDLQFTPKVSK